LLTFFLTRSYCVFFLFLVCQYVNERFAQFVQRG